MELRRTLVAFLLRAAINSICRVDCREFVEALKKNKPMIVIFNHINFLEVPALVVYSYPLRVKGLVKSETWKNPFFAFLFNTYDAVPINRNGSYSESFKKIRETINSGYFMCIAPEGTRSKNGILQKGKAGIIKLALEADAPVLPVAHHGGENIWKNLKRLRRSSICFKAGRPFKFKINEMPGREEREEIMNEVMAQMAKLLPPNMRGIYAQSIDNECKYLEFL